MNNLKKEVYLKQSKIRNKIERLNKSEQFVLQRRLKVIDKESDHVQSMVIRQKRDLTSKLREIHKCSGHSIMGLEPEPNSKALQDPIILNCPFRLSDKQLLSWRLKEKAVQRVLRIKELELKREKDREKSLIQLLKDLNIITEKPPVIYNDVESSEKSVKFDLNSEKSFCEKYPHINQMIRSNSDVERSRPQTVDCDVIKRSYIDNVLSYSKFDANLLDFSRKRSGVVLRKKSIMIRPNVLERRVKSANVNMSNRRPLSGDLKVSHKPSEKIPKKIVESVKPQEKPVEKPHRDDLFLVGISKMPKWKRQLLMEVPIGMSNDFGKSKIQVIMSQSQKRRELEQLIESNVIDVEQYAREKYEEQRKKIEAMQFTLREMDNFGANNL